jgi:hypothetical protein
LLPEPPVQAEGEACFHAPLPLNFATDAGMGEEKSWGVMPSIGILIKKKDQLVYPK